MGASKDAFGRPLDGATTSDGVHSPSPAAVPADRVLSDGVTDDGGPRPSRIAVLRVLLLSGLAGIAVAMALAVGWAHDQPKTITFALAKEPFGSRSLLRPEAARPALERALARVDPTERIVAVRLEARELTVTTRDVHDRRHWVSTTTTGEMGGYPTQLEETGRGVTKAQIAALDLDAALRAAQDRWRALGTRPEPPALRLTADDGQLREWQISFASGVPLDEQTTTIDMTGRVIR